MNDIDMNVTSTKKTDMMNIVFKTTSCKEHDVFKTTSCNNINENNNKNNNIIRTRYVLYTTLCDKVGQ
jgi:hypothetical protein